MTQRYPLQWPDGWRRIAPAYRKSASFKNYTQRLTVHGGVGRLMAELRTLGVLEGDSIISTNLPTRLDGLPRGDQAEPADTGVAVYWQLPGDKGTKVIAIDRYDRVADNCAAIAATLEAMRKIERHGGAQILERVFTGFDALPNPANRNWRDILGGDIATRAELDGVYMRLRSESHPDRGGNSDRFNDVQRAYEQAKQEIAP